MIFVTVGSTDCDFSRLFQHLDLLVKQNIMQGVQAQIGKSYYQPEYYPFRRFIPISEMRDNLTQAEYIICHAGAGTLNECLGMKKKVIVVPRQYRYQEAPDDHQFEIARYLAEKNHVLACFEIEDLAKKVGMIKQWIPDFAQSSEQKITQAITDYIQSQLSSEQ